MKRFWNNLAVSFQLTGLLVGSLFVMLGIPIIPAIITENWWWALVVLISLPLGFAMLSTLWDRIGDYR